MKRNIFITGAVVLVSVVITSLGIDAADTLRGREGTLLSSVINSSSPAVCPEGMTPVLGTTFSCVDIYEASASAECPHDSPQNPLDTKENMQNGSCMSLGALERVPWTNITREQAREQCARRSARLPTNAEWYQFALGVRDGITPTCNTESGEIAQTGAYKECVSPLGVYDLVGNVWEWTGDDALNGSYNGHALPKSGYVVQVDQDGVAVRSSDSPDDAFYKDYIWSKETGIFGILRGGYFASKEDAGVYALHAETLPTTPGVAIGFRCVQ